MLTVFAAIGFLGYLVFFLVVLQSLWHKKDQDFTLNFIPKGPEGAKLYYEEPLGRMCKRCAANNKESELRVRKRFLVFRDEAGSVKVKDLTHVYNCVTCGYKGLYLNKRD